MRPPRTETSVRYAASRLRLRPFAMRQGTTNGTILSVRRFSFVRRFGLLAVTNRPP
jgi:hypothetical protein